MIPRNDSTIAPVGRVTQARAVEVAADARQEEFQRSLATLVGKSMQATVISRMTDGTFLVQVAGATARMALPSTANPQPGAQVPLTLVSVNPRPTFAIGDANGATRTFAAAHAAPDDSAAATQARAGAANLPPVPSLLPQAGAQLPPGAQSGAAPRAPGTGSLQHAAALLGKAPLGPASALAPSEAYDAAPALSPAARVISGVLSAAQSRAEAQPSVVAARMPVVPGPVIEPGKLAAALKDAIGASGLFYESHVAEWSAGQRPLTALLREPQNQGETVPRPPDQAKPGGADPAQALREQAVADPHRLRALVFDGAAPERAASADPATAQFINLQLTSQEQGRVAWQGQLWPGQDLAWQISRDAPEGGQPRPGEPEPEPAWRSGLRFRFPLLGEIAATVVMQGDQLHIQVQAGSSQVGALLRERAGDLAGALEAAGTPLASLTVADQRGNQSGRDG